MKTPPIPAAYSRRQFVGTVAQGALILGVANAAPAATPAATPNPFAYDVSRFSRTDPSLIGWEEVSRGVCPVKEARRLAIGPGDTMHVAAGNQIVRWNAAHPQPVLDLGAPITCLAFAADGTLFAGLRSRIIVFDTDGVRRHTWEIGGPRSWFSGLAVTENDVWVADSGQRVVLRCDRAGQMLGRVGARQSERNVPGLVVPSPFLDVRVHPDGLLRINNPGRHRIEAYTADGDLEVSWGRPSAGIAGFSGCCNPIGLAILPDGRTVTCEKGLPRVKVYAPDGTFEAVVAGTESFAENQRQFAKGDGTRGGLDVAADSAGRIHILDRVTAEVRVMRPKGGT